MQISSIISQVSISEVPVENPIEEEECKEPNINDAVDVRDVSIVLKCRFVIIGS